MRAIDIITRKRDGAELTAEEIAFFVQGLTSGEIPDYQAAAWAMAVYFSGMTEAETAALTLAMARSGTTLDLHDVAPLAADKHSTGGVGDKTTLVAAPLVASLGVPVAKMSGRGLGFSGGTLDKLESIPGWRCDLSLAEFKRQLGAVGLVLSGQTADLAPADGKLYALRDVTGTVPSLPLIASSIMSKKLASGADVIVLDVKTGSGAFMQTEADALALAERMLGIGRRLGRRMAAVLSDMSQPLGRAVGNALEVQEALAALRGGGPPDLRELAVALAAEMLALAGRVRAPADGAALASAALDDGRALALFRRFIEAQGGDVRAVDEPDRPAAARLTEDLLAPSGGHVSAIDARAVGEAVVELGGGRQRKGDTVDHAVGVVLRVKVGDAVAAGQPWVTVHANDAGRLAAALPKLQGALAVSPARVEAPPLIRRVLR